jgi:hypothetical protein
MYINNTNLALDLYKYNRNESAGWILEEKYYNCDDFNYHMSLSPKKRRALRKSSSTK